MKKTILITILISALLISCKDNKASTQELPEATKVVKNKEEQSAKEPVEQANIIGNTWINKIELDSGEKWEANLETNEGVKKMLDLVEAGDPDSVEDYHNLALNLNKEKNYVVKKCNMVGPSHDNLHVFLYPLIEKIAALGEVSSTKEGAKITANIKENLEAYYNYFK